MKKFFMRFAIFIAPLLLLLAFPFFVLQKAGEFDVPSQIINLQNKSGLQVLYGPVYNQAYIKSLKVAATIANKPEVLALGDSRIMQIRSQFFKSGTNFYNAGLAISNLQDFRKFLNLIPAKSQPKILIIDINQHFFNSNTYSPLDDGAQNLMTPPKALDDGANMFISNWLYVYQHFFNGRYSASQLLQVPPRGVKLVGMDAIVERDGFRNDGSYYYGQVIKNPQNPKNFDYHFSTTLGQISGGTGEFAYGQTVSQPALAELAEFLSDCNRRGIYVVGFFAPLPHQIFSTMQNSGNYSYFFQVASAAKPLFDKYNFEMYNFSDLAELGATDSETVDGAHASEKAYARLFVSMLNQGSRLGQYSDAGFLKQQIAQTSGNYDIFPDPYRP